MASDRLTLANLFVIGLLLAATAVAGAGEAAATHFIRDNLPLGVRTIGANWHATTAGFVGNGTGQYVFAASSIEPGDFHIRAVFSFDALAESAACFILGDSDFVFEGPKGNMRLRGPLSGTTSRSLGKPPRPLRAGRPVTFEVIRRKDKLTFRIDGDEIVTTDAPTGRIARFGFRPWRARISIQDFSVVGSTELRPVQWQVPWLDLAEDEDRQTIVERSDGTYLGHPDTVLLADGRTLYVTYPLGHGGPAAVLKRSTDGGRTWSERLPVPDNWQTATNCPTIHRLTGPDGVERLILFEGNGPMRQSISTDGGATWSPLEPNGLHCVVAPIDILPLPDGQHLALYQWRGAVDGSAVYQAVSSDGGQSWRGERVIADLGGASLCEPGPVLSSDGRQIAVLIRENKRKYHTLLIYSRDQGQTWSKPVAAASVLTGDRHIIRRAADGRLVITFRDMAPGSPTRGDFVAWVGTWEDLLQRREGQYRVRLLDNPARWKDTGYAGLERLPDGTFVSTTYCPLSANRRPSVISVRFKLAELDPRAEHLSLQKQHLWTSGVGGYDTYRIPALLTAADGTVLAFCEGRKHSRRDAGDIDLLLRRSTDGGATWGPVQVVWDDGANTAGNPCPVLDRKSGRIWLAATHNLGKDHESEILARTAEGTRTVWLLYSDDHGTTWSPPREITADVKREDWTWYATGPGVGIQLRSGRLVIPCDHAMAGSKQYGSHVIYSDDGGRNWHIGGVIPDRVNECQVVETSNGDLLLNMRSYHKRHRRAVARSTDGGLTWSALRHDEALVEPVCQASLIRYDQAQAGAHPPLLFMNPASTARMNMVLRMSYDDGKSWPVQKVLHPGPGAYSSLATLPDGQVGCLYECGDRAPYEHICLARVDLGWLTDHADVSGSRANPGPAPQETNEE